MYVDPIETKVLVMALSWNYFAVGYCIMAAVEIDRVVMSLRVHVLALDDEAFAFDGDTLNQHNWELAIVPHYWFLHYYNMDPRWNCLGYLNISVVMSKEAMFVVSELWFIQPTILRCSPAFENFSLETFCGFQSLSVGLLSARVFMFCGLLSLLLLAGSSLVDCSWEVR